MARWEIFAVASSCDDCAMMLKFFSYKFISDNFLVTEFSVGNLT